MKTATTKDAGPLAVINLAAIGDTSTLAAPPYVTVDRRPDGTVALGITGTADPMPEGRHPHEIVRREQELGFLGWFGGHRHRLEAGIVEDAGQPCKCWYLPCVLHDGHCCFRTATICHKIPQGCPA